MKNWYRVVMNSAALIAATFLCVTYWRDGNHDASWGWGVSGLYIFISVCDAITEAL